jgi:acetyl-CoA carboxylase beta subunit
MWKKCLCGKKILLSKKIKDNVYIVKCPHCGAMAPIKTKQRNGRVKGLNAGFSHFNFV